MSKKLKYILGVTLIVSTVIMSILIVNFFEVKDNDAVKGSLIIWTESNTYDYIKKSADDFMELNGKAEIKVIPSGENEIETAIMSNNMPDIVELTSSETRELVEKHNNINLNIGEGAIANFSKNYVKSRINEITYNDNLLGIPITSRPLVLYLREDMLEYYGYTYSDITTWDDFITIGKEIREKSAGKVSILNAVNQDYEDLISLVIMQAMEESDDEDEIRKYIDTTISELNQSGILNKDKNGQFLARISSNNGMYELSKVEVECKWIACNVPAKYYGGNRFYKSEGYNFVVLKNYDKNNKLIKKFMDYISNNNKISEGYILNGDFFSSFMSSYNNKAVEGKINNFINISPVIVMNNIYNKAPAISDYDLYFKIRKDYE